jgi:hypothetical protein
LDLNRRSKEFGGKIYLHGKAYTYANFMKSHLKIKMLPYSFCNLENGKVLLGTKNENQLKTIIDNINNKKYKYTIMNNNNLI